MNLPFIRSDGLSCYGIHLTSAILQGKTYLNNLRYDNNRVDVKNLMLQKIQTANATDIEDNTDQTAPAVVAYIVGGP